MTMTEDELDLHGAKALAQGSHRAIYPIPGMEDILVKVMLEHQPKKPKNWIKAVKYKLRSRLFTNAQYRFLYREYQTYLDIKLEEARRGERPPISEMRGLINTSLGMGMLAEKICAKDGSVAIPASQLAKQGELNDKLDKLNEFAEQVFDWDIRANDLNAGNVVFGYRSGKEQFILIDGFGDSYLIPVRRWFSFFNQRSLSKRFRAIAEYVGLAWDTRSKKFRPKGAPVLKGQPAND